MENILTQPVGKSVFYYRYKYEGYDYYYCELIRSFFSEHQQSFNVLIGPIWPELDDTNPIIRVDFQSEHTLVKTGGRDLIYPNWGKIPSEDGQFYHVRIQNYNFFNNLDLIIEYS